jgi:hypothetical protein
MITAGRLVEIAEPTRRRRRQQVLRGVWGTARRRRRRRRLGRGARSLAAGGSATSARRSTGAGICSPSARSGPGQHAAAFRRRQVQLRCRSGASAEAARCSTRAAQGAFEEREAVAVGSVGTAGRRAAGQGPEMPALSSAAPLAAALECCSDARSGSAHQQCRAQQHQPQQRSERAGLRRRAAGAACASAAPRNAARRGNGAAPRPRKRRGGGGQRASRRHALALALAAPASRPLTSPTSLAHSLTRTLCTTAPHTTHPHPPLYHV